MRRPYIQLDGGASYGQSEHAWPAVALSDGAYQWDDRYRSNGVRSCLDPETGQWTYFPCWGDRRAGGETNDGRYHAGFAWYVDDDHPGLTTNDHGITVFDTTDEYPDRELTLGPRGGLRWERC